MSDTRNANNLASHPDRPPTDAGLATAQTTDVAKEPSGVLLPSNVVDSGGPVYHPSDSVPSSDSVHPNDSNDPVGPSGHQASTGAADQSAPHVPLLAMGTDELAERLRPVVLATAGVANLVPTMATALTRLGLHRGGGVKRSPQAGTPVFAPTSSNAKHEAAGDPAASADGITVSVESDAVTLVLDITVASRHSVLTTALAVRSAAAGFLEVAHPGRYTVKVNVLGLDPDTATTQRASEPPSTDARMTTKTLRPGPSANG